MLNDSHTSGMAELLVKVAVPCSVFMSLMRPFSTALLLESVATFFIISFIFLLGILMGYGLARVQKSDAGARVCLAYGVGFGNVGFMGIPVIQAVFGYEGLFYVAMALASFNIITFTLGVRMFDPSGDSSRGPVKVILKNPALIATFIGFGFFITGFRLPEALEGGISLIAGITSPVSMILIGAILAKQRIKETLLDFKLLPPIGVRLLVIPIASLFVLRLFVPNPIMLGVIVTLMAMPPAALTAIFAEQYGGDSVTGSRLVVIGTLLCVVTVPVISLLL